ncbi:MAG: Fic family protein [Vicingaceae bacterium]
MSTQISIRIPVFHGRKTPEEGIIVGYAAIINHLELAVPIPQVIALISDKNKKYETEGWKVFTPKHKPDETIYKQLVFALKYEGINLLIFKKLFEKLNQSEVLKMLRIEPTGIYSRKIWFLYEWLMRNKLDIADLAIKKAVPLLDEKLQYAIAGKSSPRHRIINNLPGTVNFCPLIYKTEKLDNHIKSNWSSQKNTILKNVQNDVLQRASAYLLLKDSKASFTIEGEKPRSNRAARWGNAIDQAGVNELDINELNRLQQLVIENKRFTKMGLRKQQGFIGDRDRLSKDPIPDHVSAKYQDLEVLMQGFMDSEKKMIHSDIDPVLVASILAFGFVFIHPFVDGNGRIHRYIIHHILATMNYTQQGMIFPVSASILNHIKDYNQVLELYSHSILEFIQWKPSRDHNVEVLNNTIDFYRYFDATKQAEFLYDCVQDTIENIIPQEVDYLAKFDEFKRYIDEVYEMPDDMVSLLVRFLEQGAGKLPKRALKKEFSELKDIEVKEIEETFAEVFESY